jgi:hypothetical protein
MRTRPALLLTMVCAAAAVVVAFAVEDSVAEPVQGSVPDSVACCCGGETEGCTGDCETCPECSCEEGDCCEGGTEGCTCGCDDRHEEPSSTADCHGGFPRRHCGGCH